MANSKYEYIRLNESATDFKLLRNTYTIVRLDGRGFHKFTALHNFEKPNDIRALNLMNHTAKELIAQIPDIKMAYGVSDEYSFLLGRDCGMFERRVSKIVSTLVSTFTALYVHLWPTYFPDKPLGVSTIPGRIGMLPTFDGRAVSYASEKEIRDYFSWRQVDCHINNLYNTTFHAMVLKGGMTPTAAELELKGTVSSDKNEILFSRFGINYNNELEIYKKGSVVYREFAESEWTAISTTAEGKQLSKSQQEKRRKKVQKAEIVVRHVDIIRDDFWVGKPWLLQDG